MKSIKGYSKILNKLPTKDWKIIAQFNKIVMNYLKIKKLTKEKGNVNKPNDSKVCVFTINNAKCWTREQDIINYLTKNH